MQIYGPEYAKTETEALGKTQRGDNYNRYVIYIWHDYVCVITPQVVRPAKEPT